MAARINPREGRWRLTWPITVRLTSSLETAKRLVEEMVRLDPDTATRIERANAKVGAAAATHTPAAITFDLIPPKQVILPPRSPSILSSFALSHAATTLASKGLGAANRLIVACDTLKLRATSACASPLASRCMASRR
jgi:hypothetical protein